MSVGRRPETPVVIRPATVNLGRLAPGRSARSSVTLANRIRTDVTIERVETSCPCVRLSPVPVKLGPGETASLEVSFDAAEEPNFRGSLAVEAIGYSPDDSVQFRGVIEVTVEDGAEGPVSTP